MGVLDKVRHALKTKLRVLKRKGFVVQIVCDENWSKHVKKGGAIDVPQIIYHKS